MTKTFEQQEIIENTERMKLVARLSLGRCAKCKHDKTVDCGCEASTKLKEINANWKGQVNVAKEEVETQLPEKPNRYEVKIVKLEKQLETAEHYVNRTRDLNEALQGQVDRLAKELKETKESTSGNWRELEQQVKADKLEYEKLVKDYDILHESYEKERRHNDLLLGETARVNQLNTLLMENTLKIVERVGDIA